MLSRCNYKMPLTPNSLESFHGHLNKRTPRRNGFWASIQRLAKSFIMRTQSTNKMIRHNYSYTMNNTLKRMRAMTKDKMIEQQEFYSTRDNHCNCGENKLISSIMEVDIPCCHRIAKGATFPASPSFELNTT